MHKVNYKDFNITKEERDAEEYDILTLQHYLFALKEKELGMLMCEECGSEEDLQFHHKRYGIDVNYFDLILLCKNCHVAQKIL